MEVLYILLGWLLGILSPLITNNIAHYYKKRRLQRVIIGELNDLKKRLVSIPYTINSRYGMIDKKLFIWLKAQTKETKEFDFDGILKMDFAKIDIESDDGLMKFLETLNSFRKKDDPAFNFKKMVTSVLDSNLINIGILDNEFLAKLLEVKFQISAFNQEIQHINEYLRMTFDSNITEINHQIIKKGIYDKNLLISEKAIYIVEKINCIIDHEN